MKVDFSGWANIFTDKAFSKYRWLLAIAFFIFVVTPVVGPQVNNFYDNTLKNHTEKEIREEDFIKNQYYKLENQIASLNQKIIELTNQVAILNYQRRKDRAAFLSAPIPIWVVGWNSNNRQTWLEEFNPSFERLVLLPEGIDPDTAEGQSWDELFPEEQADAYNKDDRKVLEFGIPSVTNNLYSLDRRGKKQFWEITKWPIVVEGKIVGLRGIAVKVPKDSIRNIYYNE